MACKILMAGILFLSAQALFVADAISATDSQTAEPSADQTDGTTTEGAQTPDKPSESKDKKPAEEDSDPDCQ